MGDGVGIVLVIAFILFCVAPERLGENAARVVQGYEAALAIVDQLEEGR